MTHIAVEARCPESRVVGTQRFYCGRQNAVHEWHNVTAYAGTDNETRMAWRTPVMRRCSLCLVYGHTRRQCGGGA